MIISFETCRMLTYKWKEFIKNLLDKKFFVTEWDTEQLIQIHKSNLGNKTLNYGNKTQNLTVIQ